jgi:hypothetical protein
MGRMARRFSEEEKLDYLARIAIGQDIAGRDWDRERVCCLMVLNLVTSTPMSVC